MKWYEILGIVYFLGVNVVAFTMYGIDKWKAKKDRWRISEAALLLVAALGGSAGALVGMRCFHHKTQKWKFKIGVPLLLIIQIVLYIFMILK